MSKAIDSGDNLHALSNVFINGTTTTGAGTPHDFINTRLEGIHHLLDSFLDERLFDWNKISEHIVIHFNDQFKLTSLVSVDVYSLV
jgi:hypothetical protein